jgi:hypothetical protein
MSLRDSIKTIILQNKRDIEEIDERLKDPATLDYQEDVFLDGQRFALVAQIASLELAVKVKRVKKPNPHSALDWAVEMVKSGAATED